jgi:hypothetical protein
MKYLKRFNESNISPDYSIVAPIRLDIEDRLDEFKFGYDFKFVHYDMRTTFPITSSGVLPVGNHSENNFQLQILPKGYPNSKDIDPVLINSSILGDLRTVISFIEKEIKFKYSHSYYFVEHKYDKINSDIFTSEGKLVTMIQMFFTGPDDLSYLNESVNYDSLVRVYGEDNLRKCDSLMLDIKDLSFDLLDLGFDIQIDYSHSTKNLSQRNPKIDVNIIGEDSLFDENYDDVVLPTIESIKKHVSGFGFSAGGYLSDKTRTFNRFSDARWSMCVTYVLSIQK